MKTEIEDHAYFIAREFHIPLEKIPDLPGPVYLGMLHHLARHPPVYVLLHEFLKGMSSNDSLIDGEDEQQDTTRNDLVRAMNNLFGVKTNG